MKIVWVSPEGDGLEFARAIATAGHDLVVYGASGDLPAVVKGALAPFCQAADLVVVDAPFALAPTRRSWKPSAESLFVDELRRHYHVTALGPTPTVDLLVGDARYLRKMCGRFEIPYARTADGDPWTSGAWFLGVSVVPDGPYLRPFAPLFKSVGFKGWFELTGVLHPLDGPIVTGACATWDQSLVPAFREAEWLHGMASA